jgi:cell division protein YceG involved in septum cleavage
VEIYIPPGFTSYQVAELLARQGLVKDAVAFERLIREMGASRRLVAGYHRLRLPAEPREIVEELTRQGQ